VTAIIIILFIRAIYNYFIEQASKQKRSNAPTANDLKVKLTNKNYI
jgi:hypothetical protein